ncbi:ABC transporter permease subunit [Citricoccus sp. SGAir0253]|uniref:ABC transporter permease n=1 Tax=Citricoccus sp. SGAir0253 TaxID=2567881 RepID=UPI0010CD1DB8|nr:ABC transporter permease subunit [Citricoccus sp. SGAir0253]QCU78740.1 ABC transporter permease subunit [Citricoccus sp. SGAir0253]
MTWVLQNLPLIADRTWAHLATSLPAVLAALVLAVPLGWLAHRYRPLNGPLLTGAGLLYAIPSLPLFIVLPVLIGTGVRDVVNVVVALTLYGVALLVRSVADGLDGIPPEARNAAVALGYPPLRRFLAVDLPLAGPVILSGLRVVAVSTVSLCTVGAVLGVPSLGLLFTDGFQRGILAEILTGIVLTAVLALALDRLIVLLGRLAMPWTRTAGAGA